MKSKILLLSLIAFITFSCDSSSDNTDTTVPPVNTSTLKANFNGIEQSFNVIKVEKEHYTSDDGTPYTDLIVTCTTTSDPKIKFEFNLAHLETGPDSCYYLYYSVDDDVNVDNDETYYEYSSDNKINNEFSINVTDNTETNIKGTFSGNLYEDNLVSLSHITVTNGTFDIDF